MTQVKAHHEPTETELLIASLRAENERLKANKATTGGIKVSAKGAVSVYGLGRWPVTLYAGQWEQLAQKMPEIAKFIQANAQALADQRPIKQA
jgi:uncharacterized NAD(P)/FAD-binding protein YdhS